MRKGVAVQTLCFASFHEANKGVGHDREVDELGCCNLSFCEKCSSSVYTAATYQVDKPLQHDGSTSANL